MALTEKTTFGRTGLQVSRLGFGAAPIGFLKTEREQVGRILNLLLDNGVNLIDTAAMYEGSEQLIGESVGHRRDDYVLVSKCGARVPDVDARVWSGELITRTVDRALRNLRTDWLDVMLLHSCDLETLRKGEALNALVKARDAGKVRFVGYSGDNEAAAYAAGLPDVSVLEVSVNVADQSNLDAVLSAARASNTGVIAKRPIANAAWKDLNEQPGFYKGYAKPYSERLQKMGLKPADAGISGPPEEAWPELALRFVLSQPGVHTAIIGTTREDNARRNIGYAEKGPLPPQAAEAVRAAFRRADPQGKWRGEQ